MKGSWNDTKPKMMDMTMTSDERYPSPIGGSSKKKTGPSLDIYKQVPALDKAKVGAEVMLHCTAKVKAIRQSEEGGYRYELEITKLAVV